MQRVFQMSPGNLRDGLATAPEPHPPAEFTVNSGCRHRGGAVRGRLSGSNQVFRLRSCNPRTFGTRLCKHGQPGTLTTFCGQPGDLRCGLQAKAGLPPYP